MSVRGMFATALALFGIATSTDARVWNVRPDHSGDAPTIQAAMDSARAGDEVVLASGTYTWTSEGATEVALVRIRPGVTLRGESGAEQTILDGELTGRVILCQDGGPQTTISGLTIQRGFGRAWPTLLSDNGGGILAWSSTLGGTGPTIAQCIVRDNVTPIYGKGGGIWCDEGTITNCQVLNNYCEEGRGAGIRAYHCTIIQCVIRDNTCWESLGAGIDALGGVIEDCWIEGNEVRGVHGASGGGVAITGEYGSPTFIRRTTFLANRCEGTLSSAGGGGLYAYKEAVIEDCVFVRNQVVGGGPFSGVGAAIGEAGLARLTIRRCTIIGNLASGGSTSVGGLYVFGGVVVESSIITGNEGLACAGTATYRCTDIFGNSLGDSLAGTDGGGNFRADPQFCAVDPAMSRNFELQADSPCAPGHHPTAVDCGQIGAASVGCGVVDVEPSTWSDFKKLYR